MKLLDYVGSLDMELIVYYQVGNSGPWIASLKDHGVFTSFKNSRDDAMARGCSGWGMTPDSAIRNLIQNLKEHKFVIINQYKATRIVLPLPDELEY